jgi:hypothetical protein
VVAIGNINSHWLEWAALAIADAVGWLITYTIAKPLREFWDDRRGAIEILGTDAGDLQIVGCSDPCNAAATCGRGEGVCYVRRCHPCAGLLGLTPIPIL